MSGVQVLQGALNHQNFNSARKRPDNWLETAETEDFRVELIFVGGSQQRPSTNARFKQLTVDS
ncbi:MULTISPECIES: hypothetical protein [unclassified Microcoleus]|uniref:hypothetical protein n=1 Tax=unclassified Microcoleus TaxID=2642155 RepID=UPI0025F8A21D|nr:MULTISPECIES: hypothetical protein [unclassified Microcoleus]